MVPWLLRSYTLFVLFVLLSCLVSDYACSVFVFYVGGYPKRKYRGAYATHHGCFPILHLFSLYIMYIYSFILDIVTVYYCKFGLIISVTMETALTGRSVMKAQARPELRPDLGRCFLLSSFSKVIPLLHRNHAIATLLAKPINASEITIKLFAQVSFPLIHIILFSLITRFVCGCSLLVLRRLNCSKTIGITKVCIPITRFTLLHQCFL